jgi:hypothetical protein
MAFVNRVMKLSIVEKARNFLISRATSNASKKTMQLAIRTMAETP